MVDITKYPYFSYNHIMDELLIPLRSQVSIQPIGFRRNYNNHDRFLINYSLPWAIDYYGNKFYQYGLFEKDPKLYKSSFNMWDHLGCDPHGIYEYFNNKFSFSHGLTVVEQHGQYCDFFVFTTTTEGSRINNFYLNKKDMFDDYIEQFYSTFAPTLKELSKHTFNLVGNTNSHEALLRPLSPRQQDCIKLLSEGFTSKEIAKRLGLSPRTIEEHINILKSRFDAKNRVHLMNIIKTNI